jgi:putative nucleotidyltransferase with HDIG domain
MQKENQPESGPRPEPGALSSGGTPAPGAQTPAPGAQTPVTGAQASGAQPSIGAQASGVQSPSGAQASGVQAPSGAQASGAQPPSGAQPAQDAHACKQESAPHSSNGAAVCKQPSAPQPGSQQASNAAASCKQPSTQQASTGAAACKQPSAQQPAQSSAAKPEPAARPESISKPEPASRPEAAMKSNPAAARESRPKAMRADGPARPGRKRSFRGGEEKHLQPALTSLAIAVATFVVLFLMMASAISPERYDLKAGEVSARTITASKDVTDTITTQMLVDAAVREVQPSYQSDETVMPAVLARLEDSFAQLRALAQLRVGMDGTVTELTEEALTKAKQAMRPVEMSEAALTKALDADDGTLSEIAAAAVGLTREALNAKVAEGQERETASKIERDLVGDGYDQDLAAAAGAVVATHMKANMLLDEETTELKRQAARESVEDIVFKKGQNIVRAGEVVTRPQIEMLNSLGMLKDRAVDMSLYLGLALLLTLLALVLVLYIYSFVPDMIRDPKRVALISVILTTTLAWAMAFRSVSAYLMPVALGAMLTTRLLKPRLAIVVNAVLSILTGLLAAADKGLFTATMFGVMLTAMVAGTAVVPVIRGRNSFAGVMLAGAIVVLINTLTTVAVGLVNSADIQNVMGWAVWSGGSGLVSAVLTILEAMLFEWAFNLVTASKLMELSNPNKPLLRRLLLETPGTYHHSILVANLAEAAASAVGANALLARVGAYYHDIGKLKRPIYFKENQLSGDNPHDRTDPRVSTAILTAHPHDGVEMAVRERLPEEIQEIILQHHGDSPVLYFYDKAARQGGDVDVADFRYDGPRPRSREAAIVMMADTIEAAARAAGDSSPEKLAQLIRKMIHGKLEDGQFDESLLTFSELSRISDAFLTVLNGVYHDRIEYPEVSIPNRPPMPRRPWPDAGREPNDEPKRADA